MLFSEIISAYSVQNRDHWNPVRGQNVGASETSNYVLDQCMAFIVSWRFKLTGIHMTEFYKILLR
jgi:hypothetical protein